jgi:hypothetical protein
MQWTLPVQITFHPCEPQGSTAATAPIEQSLVRNVNKSRIATTRRKAPRHQPGPFRRYSSVTLHYLSGVAGSDYGFQRMPGHFLISGIYGKITQRENANQPLFAIKYH